MKKILLFGSVYTELVSYVDALPKGNEDFVVKESESRTGGLAYIICRILNGFSFPYSFMASLGTGVYSEMPAEDCRKENIPLHQTSEELNGCVYTLMDPDGNTAYFSVPGAELSFDINRMSEIDPKEISQIVVLGDQLCGDDAYDLIDVLDDLDKPFLFVPGERMDEIDPGALKAVMALHPKVFCTEQQAYYMGDETKDLASCARKLADAYGSKVLIYKEGEGVFVRDDTETYIAPIHTSVNYAYLLAGYIAAMNGLVDDKNALMFAGAFASGSRHSFPGERYLQSEKKRLAGIILQK